MLHIRQAFLTALCRILFSNLGEHKISIFLRNWGIFLKNIFAVYIVVCFFNIQLENAHED